MISPRERKAKGRKRGGGGGSYRGQLHGSRLSEIKGLPQIVQFKGPDGGRGGLPARALLGELPQLHPFPLPDLRVPDHPAEVARLRDRRGQLPPAEEIIISQQLVVAHKVNGAGELLGP